MAKGGKNPVFKIKLTFISCILFKNLHLKGAAWGGTDKLMIYDEKMNKIGESSCTGGNTLKTCSISNINVQGYIFYIEEINGDSTWRYRESLKWEVDANIRVPAV
mgnify:CR=1 FL=1